MWILSSSALSMSKTTFVQWARMQRYLKTILTVSCRYSLDNSHCVLSNEYPHARVSGIFELFCIILHRPNWPLAVWGLIKHDLALDLVPMGTASMWYRFLPASTGAYQVVVYVLLQVLPPLVLGGESFLLSHPSRPSVSVPFLLQGMKKGARIPYFNPFQP